VLLWLVLGVPSLGMLHFIYLARGYLFSASKGREDAGGAPLS
jgi:hypothetical protein